MKTLAFFGAIVLLCAIVAVVPAQRDDPPPPAHEVGQAIGHALRDIKILKADVAKLKRDRCCCKH